MRKRLCEKKKQTRAGRIGALGGTRVWNDPVRVIKMKERKSSGFTVWSFYSKIHRELHSRRSKYRVNKATADNQFPIKDIYDIHARFGHIYRRISQRLLPVKLINTVINTIKRS